jgi:hypothetical protein
MPTYTNSANGIIQLKDITFGALEEKRLYNYLDLTEDTTGYISLTSHTPYYNPVIADTSITGTDETVTHNLTNIESSSIRIVYLSGSVKIYLNTLDNIPGMTIKENVTINNRGRIYRVYVEFTGYGEILLQENL